jgi:hypothetical protein
MEQDIRAIHDLQDADTANHLCCTFSVISLLKEGGIIFFDI